MDDFRQMINSGELTSDDTITLARTAAEAIRGLNWATNTGAGLDQPAVAYDVLGALSMAASRLGQAFTQITRYLDPRRRRRAPRPRPRRGPRRRRGCRRRLPRTTPPPAPPPWPATWTPPSSRSPPSTATPPPATGRTSS